MILEDMSFNSNIIHIKLSGWILHHIISFAIFQFIFNFIFLRILLWEEKDLFNILFFDIFIFI